MNDNNDTELRCLSLLDDIAGTINFCWKKHNCSIKKTIYMPDVDAICENAIMHPKIFELCLKGEDFAVSSIIPCYNPVYNQDGLPEESIDKTKSDCSYQLQIAIAPFDMNDDTDKVLETCKNSLLMLGFSFSVYDKEKMLEIIPCAVKPYFVDEYINTGWNIEVKGLTIAKIICRRTFAGIDLEKPFIEVVYMLDIIGMLVQNAESAESIDRVMYSVNHKYVRDITLKEQKEKEFKAIKSKDRDIAFSIVDAYIDKGLPNKLSDRLEVLITAYVLPIISPRKSHNIKKKELHNIEMQTTSFINYDIKDYAYALYVYRRFIRAINMFNILEHKYGSKINRISANIYFSKIGNLIAKQYKSLYEKEIKKNKEQKYGNEND